MKYLLDTSIIIDFLTGRAESKKWILGLDRAQAFVSPITVGEVLACCAHPAERESAERVLKLFPCLTMDYAASSQAALLNKEFGFTLVYAYQCALAAAHHLVLITSRPDHYDAKRHPFVRVPYKSK